MAHYMVPAQLSHIPVSDDFQRIQAGAPIKAVKLGDIRKHLPRRFADALEPVKLRAKIIKRLREVGLTDAKDFPLDSKARLQCFTLVIVIVLTL
jgi:hypothetical protein